MGRITAILLSALLLTDCQKHSADAESGGAKSGKIGPIDPQLAESTNRFGFNLLGRLSDTAMTTSTMISPASVAMALAMTYNGADGSTKAQMAEVLQVPGWTLEDVNIAHKQLREALTDPNADVTLAIANSLWAREGVPFDTNFMARNRDDFAARVENLDFDDPASVDVINEWVKANTKDKIPSIVDRIEPATILFLINAIYFKGTWTYTFDPRLSYNREFHHPTGDQSHKFMSRQDDYEYLDGDGFTAVRLPYGKSQRFGMYVFLPDEGSTLSEFAAKLTAEDWKAWTATFATHEGQVHLPRFKLTYDASLKEALADIGMPEAFDPIRADLTRMISIPDGNAYISKVKHKTYMEVNEEGTEAAAVTSVEIGITSFGPDSPFQMIVDRPFFCAISDRESGLILFMGTVNEFE